MKTFILFVMLGLLSMANAQDGFDPFRIPLAYDRPSEIYPPPGPVNTDPVSPLFFNINITQNSAPQNEPSVCISRKHPNRVVAAWRDFRYGVDPSANRRVGYSFSTNSGLTWSNSQILDSTLLPGLTRNSDPVVTVDTAGNFYIAVITINLSGSNLVLAVYKSTDFGVTFPQAYIVAQSGTEDKEWITTDLSPVSPFRNNLYISWTRFSGSQGIKLTRSTNSGVNWSDAVNVSSSSSVQGSNVAVSRDGQVNVTWLGFASTGNVMFDRSTDGGLTFGTDVLVSSGEFPSGLPNNVNTFPWIATDITNGPRSGWIYITFADNRNGDCDVFFTRSTNNGLSWSAPLRVNNDPVSNGKIQYWPVLACSETNGNLAIVFMDTRNTANNTIIEAYLARSYDGGNTFTNELISAEPSPTSIPGSNVRFGDYIDIDYVGTSIIPVWTDERLGGFNMEIYTSEIDEVLGVRKNINTSPADFVLFQNFPNPFNPSTKIQFVIPAKAGGTLRVIQSNVKLTIYNSLGQIQTTLINKHLTPGTYDIDFNGTNYPGGIYFYSLYSDNKLIATKKMLLIK